MPTGVFKVKEGGINIQASNNRLFGRFCRAIGGEELIEDPRFKTHPDRQAHKDELTVELEKRLATRTMNEWVTILNEAGVPSGPLLNVKESFEDPQVQHLGMAKPVEHPELGTINLVGFGVNLERTPPQMRSAAPEQGEHNQEILAELGYSPAEIEDLRKQDAI